MTNVPRPPVRRNAPVSKEKTQVNVEASTANIAFQEPIYYSPQISSPQIKTGIDVFDSILGTTNGQSTGKKNFHLLSPSQQEEERQAMILEISRIVNAHPHLAGGYSPDNLRITDLTNLQRIKFMYQYHEKLQINIMYLDICKGLVFLFIEHMLRRMFDIDLPGYADRESRNPAYNAILHNIALQYTTMPGEIVEQKPTSPISIFLQVVVVNMVVAIIASKIGARPDVVRASINEATNSMNGDSIGGIFSILSNFMK